MLMMSRREGEVILIGHDVEIVIARDRTVPRHGRNTRATSNAGGGARNQISRGGESYRGVHRFGGGSLQSHSPAQASLKFFRFTPKREITGKTPLYK